MLGDCAKRFCEEAANSKIHRILIANTNGVNAGRFSLFIVNVMAPGLNNATLKRLGF